MDKKAEMSLRRTTACTPRCGQRQSCRRTAISAEAAARTLCTCEMMEHTQQFKQILIKGLRTNRRAGRNRMAAGRVLQLRPQPNKGPIRVLTENKRRAVVAPPNCSLDMLVRAETRNTRRVCAFQSCAAGRNYN